MSSSNVYQLRSIESTEGFYSRASMSVETWGLSARCESGEDSYIVGYRLPDPVVAHGVTFNIRLRDWESIKYAAVGYMYSGTYCHIKSLNIKKDGWVSFGFSHSDIIWVLQGGEKGKPAVSMQDIRIFVKGEPKRCCASIDISSVCLQVSSETEGAQDLNLYKTPPNSDVVDAIYAYLERNFRDYSKSAEEYMTTGQCPMPGKKFLDWSIREELPTGIDDVNTFKYAWNAQHPAINLLLYAHENNDLSAVIAAKSLVEAWLSTSFYKQPVDLKYAWYDHGTAERLLALILLWEQGTKNQFELRFMSRLDEAIKKHADLLSSEAFYAFNQRLRYHNHAWFQDAALLAAALVRTEAKNAEFWRGTAISRFNDQLEHLIVRDRGYAVFVENSIGYHHGVQNLAKFFGELVSLSGEDSEIPRIAKELVAWSDFLRYPDGRVPAQGDTFRLPPRSGEDVRRGKPWDSPGCTVLPDAGYAVVKGNHEGKPWMLCLFNTSLSSTHKHEDNLSATLWFDGVEWFTDPSFYSHEYSESVSAFLRSSAAHSGPYIPDSEYELSFSSDIKCEIDENQVNLKASHNAIAQCVITREIKAYIGRFSIEITDAIGEGSDLDFCVGFQVPENVDVEKSGSVFYLSCPDSDYILEVTSSAENLVASKLIDSFVGQTFMAKEQAKRILYFPKGAKFVSQLKFIKRV